jgi:hypothetical protein
MSLLILMKSEYLLFVIFYLVFVTWQKPSHNISDNNKYQIKNKN